jgi:hypothetical protein
VDAFEQFARGGLAWLGMEADETDVQIMRYIDQVFGPELRALLEADMSAWWPENDLDPSRAPSS